MVKKFALALLLLLAGNAFAEDYRFSVDRNYSDVFIRPDGGIDIKYEITFSCKRGAKAIDVVDVGFPNDYYQFDSVKAWLDGNPINDIRRSSYIPIGVEVHLGDFTIKPGEQATLEVKGTNPHMVFPDSQDSSFAGMEFSPVYFGKSFTEGVTDLKVSIHFPQGAQGQNVKWHYSQFNESGTDQEQRLTYTWRLTQADPASQYKFGVSFPQSLVTQVFETLEPEAYSTESPAQSSDFRGLIIIIVLGGIFFVFYIFQIMIRGRQRMKYFPPVASVEGIDIKRGLTAPEAAILLELPLNKVAAMIIFGLQKKSAANIEPGTDLRLKVLNRNAGGLHSYEKNFLDLVKPDGTITENGLQKFFVKMINGVNAAMKGFNIPKTREHYRAIISEAWKALQEAGSSEALSSNLERSFPWLMCDEHMEDRLEQTIGPQQVSMPTWFYSGHHASLGGTNVTSGSFSGVDFANQVVTKIENLSNRAVTRLENFTMGVTNKTNPPAIHTSGGSNYGGGCACACACACAGCACACAGGGR